MVFLPCNYTFGFTQQSYERDTLKMHLPAQWGLQMTAVLANMLAMNSCKTGVEPPNQAGPEFLTHRNCET